jgi:hypothetical protein
MAKKDKSGGTDKVDPKETAVQHMKEALARVQAARAAANNAGSHGVGADKGGKGPKGGAAAKGRMFRHQGR